MLTPFNITSSANKLICYASFIGRSQHASIQTLNVCRLTHQLLHARLLWYTLEVSSEIIFLRGRSFTSSSQTNITTVALLLIKPFATKPVANTEVPHQLPTQRNTSNSAVLVPLTVIQHINYFLAPLSVIVLGFSENLILFRGNVVTIRCLALSATLFYILFCLVWHGILRHYISQSLWKETVRPFPG